MSDYRGALEGFEVALTVFRDHGNKGLESITLNNLGEVYRLQGRSAEALAYFQQALLIRREVGDRAGEGITLNNLGAMYQAQGRYGEALAYFQQALTITRAVGDRATEGATLNNLGALYQVQGRYGEAETHFEQVLAMARAVGDPIIEGTTLNNLGAVYEVQGRYGEALTHYQQALTIQRALGDAAGEGITLNNLGEVYRLQGRYGEVLTHNQQALTIRRALGDPAGEAGSLNNLGAVYQHQGQYGEALTHYQQALAIARAVGDRIGEGKTLHNMGEVYWAQKRYAEAQPHLEAAVAIMDSLRQRAGSSLARRGFLDQFAAMYRHLVLNTLRLGLSEKAFVLSERGRARTLLDELTSGSVTLSDTFAGQLLQQEQDLFTQRRAIDDELARRRAQPGVSRQDLADLEARRVQIEQDYGITLARLRAANEELAALASGEPLGVKEVQHLLPPHMTLLAYFVLDDVTIAAFLLTRTQFEVVELPVNGAALVDNIQSFRLSFADLNTVHTAALVNLHTSLITPLLKHISTPHLILVPHTVLHYMPFAALTDGTTYLGDRFLLSTLPSASTLPFVLRKRKDPATLPPPLIFGNPTTAKADLPPLGFAEVEATHIGQLYGVTPLMRDRATEQTLIEQAGSAGIVHLAAHGEFNAAEPLESFIALAPDPGKHQDGQLTVREVYNTLRLDKVDLVVLSACESNVGEVSNGDEIVGLTRAFIFAGTPSVIATLWRVRDEQTGLLMEHFYTLLRAGASKAAALQKAQQAVRKAYPHPYYWGAFVLTGDGGNVTAHPGLRELPR
jgi:CHAT domain-containing protein/tetratricopeptide (TPR) repeat protein